MYKQVKAYASSLKLRYKKARRKEKRVILDEFTKTADYDRKYAAKLLRGAYQYTNKITLTREDRKRVLKISPATIDRLFKKYRKRPKLKGRSYTKSGTLLKSQIPIRTFSGWDENKVGFEEIDLVGHEGGLAKGDFAHTLNWTDVKVCWTEQVAVINKAQVHVFAGIERIRARLPFFLLGIDSDSGSEFINAHLYRYCISLVDLKEKIDAVLKRLKPTKLQ